MHDDQQPRRVIPRWRTSRLTATMLEAKSISAPSTAKTTLSQSEAEVSSKLAEFEAKKSIPIAAELMFIAANSGSHNAAQIAAKLIIQHQEQIGSRQLTRTAKQILSTDDPEHTEATSQDFVANARKVLTVNYRNPVLLMDTARELTAMRHDNAALRYVKAAMALAPNSRFITRSAVRYYLHTGDHELAHRILLRSPLLASDPWIQASEVAVATVRGRSSNLTKQRINQLIDTKFAGAELSELTSAAGTVEMLSGSIKKAKTLFKHSLHRPNDNSLAQAEWAATKLNLVVDNRALQTPLSFEANSHNAYRNFQIEKAIEFADQWAVDEPFASRPMSAKCYLLSLDGRYEEALEAAKIAFELDSADLSPSLNYLFAKILSGNLEDAFSEILRLGKHPDLKNHATQYLANAGALAYSIGEIDQGRQLYQRAIQASRAKGEPGNEALARAFFARNAIAFNDPLSSEIIREASEIIPRLPNIGALYIIQGLVGGTKKQEIQRTAENRIAKQSWKWDAISNTLQLLDP